MSEGKVTTHYRGLTYLPPLDFRIVRWVWRRVFCSRAIHLFDEVWSIDRHSLHCDACELSVLIKGFDDTYVRRP